MQLEKIQGHPGLVKDVNSGAILNLNAQQAIKARERKLNMKKQQQEFDDMKESVHELKTDVSEIKTLLNKIVERL